jgi:hypothetical protein
MRHDNEDMAWRRLQDVQREAENRRLIAAGGPPTTGGGAGLIADVGWGFVHALGLAPRWWARDSGDSREPDASTPQPVRRPGRLRRLVPRG